MRSIRWYVPTLLVAILLAAVLVPVAMAILPQTDPAPATAWRLSAPPGLPTDAAAVVAIATVLFLAQTVPRVLGYGRRHRHGRFAFGSLKHMAERLPGMGFTLRIYLASAYDVVTRWRHWPAPRFGV